MTEQKLLQFIISVIRNKINECQNYQCKFWRFVWFLSTALIVVVATAIFFKDLLPKYA